MTWKASFCWIYRLKPSNMSSPSTTTKKVHSFSHSKQTPPASHHGYPTLDKKKHHPHKLTNRY